MKITKIFAAIAASAVAVSSLAVSAFATYEVPSEKVNAEKNVAYILGDEAKGEDGPFNGKTEELEQYVGVIVTIELNEADANDCATGGATWVGGGVGFNSESTGWEQHEWTPKPASMNLDKDGNIVDADNDGEADPVKEVTLEKVEDGVYTATFIREDGSSIFKSTDTYAQVWIQDWSTGSAKIAGVTFLTAEDLNADEPSTEEPSTEEPSTEPEEDNTIGDSTSTVGDSTSEVGDTEPVNGDTTAPDADNTDTGVAVAVIPAAVAAAGLAAATIIRKRK